MTYGGKVPSGLTYAKNVLTQFSDVDKMYAVPYTGQNVFGKQVKKSRQVIGVKDPALQAVATDGTTKPAGELVTLTTTLFDYTTYPDQAEIQVYNGTGGTVNFYGLAIRGKPVVKQTGVEGYIHDYFKDDGRIETEGEHAYYLENSFIMNLAQVDKLADMHWKLNQGRRHVYSLALPGRLLYNQPDQWLRLTFGAAGQPEYIDSLCRVLAMSCQVSGGEFGYTTLVLEEVYENWKEDSNYTARFVVGGSEARKERQGYMKIAASTYIGSDADYYCDGTADDVEIQAAIDAISEQSVAGSVIEFTEGAFDISATISVYDNITLVGAGKKTILYKSFTGNDNTVEIVGDDVNVRDLVVTDTAVEGTGAAFYCKEQARITFSKLYVYYHHTAFFFEATSGSSAIVSDIGVYNCTVDLCSVYGVRFFAGGLDDINPSLAKRLIVENNFIKLVGGTSSSRGVYAHIALSTGQTEDVKVSKNVFDVSGGYALYSGGAYVGLFTGNTISNTAYGAKIASGAGWWTVSDNEITGATTGVDCTSSLYFGIQGNVISGTSGNSITVSGGPGTIVNNKISACTNTAILVTDSEKIVVSGNNIRGISGTDQHGIFVTGGADINVNGNNVYQAEKFGIVVDGAATRVTVCNNVVDDCGPNVVAIGVAFGEVTYCVCSGNTSNNNVYSGFYFDNADFCAIASNTATGNVYGMVITSGCDRDSVTGNVLYTNTTTNYSNAGSNQAVSNNITA